MNFSAYFVTGASSSRHLRARKATLAGAVLLVLAAAGCKKTPPAPEAAPAPASPAAAQPSGAAQMGSLADRLNKVMSGAADKQSSATPLPDWKPIPPGSPNPPIPLVKGLIVNTAIAQVTGDYESFKTIQDVSPATVHMQYKASVPEPVLPGTPKPAPGTEPKLKETKCIRTIDGVDLLHANAYNQFFCGPAAEEHFPGSTAISASTDTLNQLRTGQKVDFYYKQGGIGGMLSMFMPKAEPGSAGAASPHPGMTHCMLSRAEPADAAFPVLLNGLPVVLPALHATCSPEGDGDDVTIYYLDQPENPLSLAWQIGGDRLQVIRITLPPPLPPPAGGRGGGGGGAGKGAGAGAGAMEAALAEKKPVEVYGIYFDFNSSVIKPESELVLKQISDIMHKNPDWKLNVSGHTDNIGDGPFNEALSQRRSAAVKAALVSRYGIAPERLDTAGYGASQPIDDNKTLEGRARNRRVELRRE